MHQLRPPSVLWTLTKLLLRRSFFYERDPLQDGPEHGTQGEDVCLSCVG